MKLSKFDIGAEIISIITKGMYPDPKDAIREYIQNGIDAKASKMQVKVRQESIVIQDDGFGMNRDGLRKAVRVGVSDKNPSKDVGFMGIGIYSAFHLCEKMSIYSRGSENIPNLLEMDFGNMKSILENQRNLRLEGVIDSGQLMDLQSLLEKCINLTEDGELPDEELPTKGTRVELSGIESEFYFSLSNFEDVKFYLQNVIPLHFDRENFTYASLIEEKIDNICSEKNQKFEIVDLTLQVNSQIENLFRPYTDRDFHNKSIPLEPQFELLQNGEFFGIAWGCLNSERRKLANRELRGFIMKKQGFSIGRRENLVKFFPRGNTFFDRYSGEVIIVNDKILPNASRNDIEFTPLRNSFYNTLKEVADKYDDAGHEYQEKSKAREHLFSITDKFKSLIGTYNEYETNPETLINHITKVKELNDTLTKAIKRKGFDSDSEKKANDLLTNIIGFEKTIQERVTSLIEKNKRRKKEKSESSKTEIAQKVEKINIQGESTNLSFESLLSVFEYLEFELSEELVRIIELIDEIFVQGVASNIIEYKELLLNLKERYEQD